MGHTVFRWKDLITRSFGPFHLFFTSSTSQTTEKNHAPKKEQQSVAFFNQLAKEIKQHQSSCSSKPLSAFTDPGELQSSKIHLAIWHLGNLKKEEKLYKAHKEKAEASILDLIAIEKNALTQQNKYQQTPLHLLAAYGTINQIERLFSTLSLQSGDKDQAEQREQSLIGTQDNEGRTALHLAAQRDDSTIADYLLKKKADPHSLDLQGEVPLHYAAKAYAPWIQKLYTVTDQGRLLQKSNQHTIIWQKALKEPQEYDQPTKKTVDSTSIWDLDPDYCLLSSTIIKRYETALNCENNAELLKEAQKDKIFKYTIITLVPLFNRLLEDHTYFAEIVSMLWTNKESELACIALRHPIFVNKLLTEEKLEALINLSKKHPLFALAIFNHHIDLLTDEDQASYLEALCKHYHADDATLQSISQAIATEESLRRMQIFMGQSKINSIKSLVQYFYTNFTSFITKQDQDTLLHIAVKCNSIEAVSEILNDKKSERLCEKTDKYKQTPLEIALLSKQPNVEIIRRLLDKTDNIKLLKKCLPDALKNSLLEDEYIKACIENYPYHLKYVLTNRECLKQYDQLHKRLSEQATLEEKTAVLLNQFEQNPLSMLLSLKISIFEKYIQSMLTDPKLFDIILNLIEQYQKILNNWEIEQLALAVFKQGLTIQKKEKKKIFFEKALKAWATTFPQVALYALDAPYSSLLTTDHIENIGKAYIANHYNNRLTLEDENVYREKLQRLLTRRIAINNARIGVLNEGNQLLAIKDERKKAEYVRNTEYGVETRDTILDRTIRSIENLQDGLAFLEPHLESWDQQTNKDLTKFLSFFESAIASYKDIQLRTHFKNKEENTFLHLAAKKNDQAEAIINACLQKNLLTKKLIDICNIKDSSEQTPLEVALAAKNSWAVKLLMEYTTDKKTWQNFYLPYLEDTRFNDMQAEKMRIELSAEFSYLKKEARLLHNAYREAFKECKNCLTSSTSYENSIEALSRYIQKNDYACYVITDWLYLFEYLLEAPNPAPIIKVLSQHKAFQEAMEDKDIYERLQKSKHLYQITQAMAQSYGYDTDSQKQISLKDLQNLITKAESAYSLKLQSKPL